MFYMQHLIIIIHDTLDGKLDRIRIHICYADMAISLLHSVVRMYIELVESRHMS